MAVILLPHTRRQERLMFADLCFLSSVVDYIELHRNSHHTDLWVQAWWSVLNQEVILLTT